MAVTSKHETHAFSRCAKDLIAVTITAAETAFQDLLQPCLSLSVTAIW